MSRMSVSFSKTNEEWITAQVEAGEYASKSEVINAVIREKRQKMDAQATLMAQLEEGRRSGVSNKTIDDIFEEALTEWKRKNG